jgi:cell fate regulator YaaT (PSP1 superfamily)
MTVVSIKFKGRGKTYYFDPNGLTVPEGAQVVVETSKGLELATCVQGNHEVTDERIVPPLRPVARIATADDLRIAELCKAREKEAFAIAEQKIAEHGLDMKLVDVECNFEGSKILFFFTSDGRVDFRELVKDLAGVFRTRIELRQIGVRDEAKMLGGIGICGLPFCCHQFMDDFEPVSTKMAKTQSLSLNPTKISGSCGRLMCCLRYEQEAYEELVKGVPKSGAFVETTAGYGSVTQVNLLRQTVKVRLDDDESIRSFDADEVAAVPGGRPKPGETPPHVLKAVPKKKPEPEAKEDPWVMPPIFAEDTAETEDKPEGESKRGASRRRRGRGKSGAVSGDKPAQSKPEKAEKPAARAEKPAAEAGKSEGEKSGSRRRRRKPSGQQQPQQNQGQQKKQAANPQAPKKEQPAQVQAKPSEGGEKKSSSHRRHRKPKPKAPGDGGGKSE